MVPEPKGEQQEGHPHALLRLHDFDSPWLQPYPAVSRPVPAVPRGCLLKNLTTAVLCSENMTTQWELWLALVSQICPSLLKRSFSGPSNFDELFVVDSMPIKVFIKMMIC